ncbi:uncharacterized protein FA14DRAFT_177391 [Meira miltonrushii]|uniref:YCII-related domain-containing protein n=1 Tax=Meira miltonrushii TaxID=1280837 RepID=A0A316VKJ5_9BASI|nr:uncharacterized protein FA14DRAFT_177391 [Meira miltonrushii]PWN38112.1 hypothetical protein FA14DRAFT_177391 [Meira miltonrushii]
MSGYSAEILNDQSKHHWSIKMFDRENGLADRNAHFGTHKARLAEFKQQNPGVIEFGGPMISPDNHQPIGSCFVFKRGELFPNVDAVNKWIENDEYHKQKVWERRDISLFIAATDPWTSQK